MNSYRVALVFNIRRPGSCFAREARDVVLEVPVIVNLVGDFSETSRFWPRAVRLTLQWAHAKTVAKEQFLVEGC